MAKKSKTTKRRVASKSSPVRKSSSSSTSSMANAVSKLSTNNISTTGAFPVEQQLTPVNTLLVLMASYFIAQSVIVYLASVFFPHLVVLGTDAISPMMAVIYSMFVHAVIVVGTLPVIESVAKVSRIKLSDLHWMLIYFIVNILVLWMVGRFAEVLGLGVASWMVVVAVAFVLNAAQGFITTTVMSMMKK